MIQLDIARIRLNSQHIGRTRLKTVREILSWMGAIQAQDYPIAKWAIGVRLPGSTDQEIEAAIDNAEIIRTHLLRPTWHFVAAEDVFWLLELTAPQVKAAQSSRDRQLELTEAVFKKSNSIIEKALRDGRHLTRAALVAELNKAGIATDQNRASHLFARAELEKIICSGAIQDGKPTYGLLSDRVPKPRHLTKDEALAQLAKRYFTSRCPATLQDFAWWSGLPAADARQAFELVKSDFHPETIEGHTCWFPDDLPLPHPAEDPAYFLPTYDEFILSYADRSASIPSELESHLKAISDRGVFRPILVVNGQVIGVWKRTIKIDTMILEIQPFTKANQSIMDLIDKAASQYGIYLDKKIAVKL